MEEKKKKKGDVEDYLECVGSRSLSNITTTLLTFMCLYNQPAFWQAAGRQGSDPTPGSAGTQTLDNQPPPGCNCTITFQPFTTVKYNET